MLQACFRNLNATHRPRLTTPVFSSHCNPGRPGSQATITRKHQKDKSPRSKGGCHTGFRLVSTPDDNLEPNSFPRQTTPDAVVDEVPKKKETEMKPLPSAKLSSFLRFRTNHQPPKPDISVEKRKKRQRELEHERLRKEAEERE
ncbi:hypothetical protein GCK32_016280, partial [Trichostrongylus colubriformis]